MLVKICRTAATLRTGRNKTLAIVLGLTALTLFQFLHFAAGQYYGVFAEEKHAIANVQRNLCVIETQEKLDKFAVLSRSLSNFTNFNILRSLPLLHNNKC